VSRIVEIKQMRHNTTILHVSSALFQLFLALYEKNEIKMELSNNVMQNYFVYNINNKKHLDNVNKSKIYRKCLKVAS